MEGCYRHRDLFHLGPDPGLFIEYPGGNGYYYSALLEESLTRGGVQYTSEDLDRIFLPFMAPHVRRIVEAFGGLNGNVRRHRTLTDREFLHKQLQMPKFDIRRLHYLRCGRMDIGRTDARPLRLLSPILSKSRDEIENIIDAMERSLRPGEIRSYLYCALDLQGYFGKHTLRHHPEALDPERVDAYFLEALCALNACPQFFQGVDGHTPGCLHPHLARYVILYFDNSFSFDTLWTEELLEYIRRSQAAGRSHPHGSVSFERALSTMGLSASRFESMTRSQLIHCYRNRAKRVHPDSGGSHDDFIELSAAYDCLIDRK